MAGVRSPAIELRGPAIKVIQLAFWNPESGD